MFINISTFDLVDGATNPGQCESPPVRDFDRLTVALAASVPSLFLVVTILLLIRQNLDRMIIFIHSIRDCLLSLRMTRQTQAGNVSAETIVIQQFLPRNLTDSELAASNENELVRPLESVV